MTAKHGKCFYRLSMVAGLLLAATLTGACEEQGAALRKGQADEDAVSNSPHSAASEIKEIPERAGQEPNDVTTLTGDGQPKIMFEKTVHDFNEVGTGTQNVCQFRFENAGGGVLKITDVSTTCGCTLSTLEKKEYGPGESGVLKVRYQATSADALISKHLYVYSNDPVNPKVELTLKAKVVMRIDISPKRLNFSLAEDAESPELTITEKEGQPFSIKKFTSAPSGITADFDPNQKAVKFVLKPKVDRSRLNRGLGGYIELQLAHPECPRIQIPFSLLAPFRVNPPTIALFNVEPGVPVRRQVWVFNNYGRDFEVESIASERGSVKVLKQEKNETRYSIDLEITPPEHSEGQPIFSDTINIRIKNDEVLQVICRGFYKRK